jgi:glycosyltransferase involved in cell wall biosynthesis
MKIFLVDLESIPNRYTCEWKTWLPLSLGVHGFDVEVIEGDTTIPNAVTPGAFLNFGGTNMYKATQVHRLAEAFTLGKIQSGDHIIFTDAWHPGIINVKYMSSLLNIPVVTHGLWHAGSYDPYDFLGRLVGDKPWIRHAEQAMMYAFDYNWIATKSHYDMIQKIYPSHDVNWQQTGWPMGYTRDMIRAVNIEIPKENIIVFPHRIAPEKRVDLFKQLSKAPELSHYEFVVAMEHDLSKTEYHELLLRSKFAVSFAEQETLGISMYEAACAGAIPLVPNRLSYVEMYIPEFKRADTISSTVEAILDYEQLDMSGAVASLVEHLHRNYFTAGNLFNELQKYK